RVTAEGFADEAFDEGVRVFSEQKSYRCVARRAAVGVGGRLAQIRRHFLNETGRRRAVQNALRDAAAEWRVHWLMPELDGHSSPPTVSAAVNFSVLEIPNREFVFWCALASARVM